MHPNGLRLDGRLVPDGPGWIGMRRIVSCCMSRRVRPGRPGVQRAEHRALARAARAKRRAVAMEIAAYPATRSASTAVLPVHLRPGL